MRDELKKLKSRLKREEKADEKTGNEEVKADDDAMEDERKSILEQGKSYIKPLGLDSRKALKISGIIVGGLIVAIVAIFAFMIYRLESDSDLVYGASKVIPFPAARVDGSFVGYDEYLFELRTLKSSSASQLNAGEDVDFTTDEGQEQLETLKTLAMAEAQRKTVVEKLAGENDVSISGDELDEEIDHFIEQEGGQEQLEQAIDDFFGWSLRDFRNVIHIQMLEQRLAEDKAEEVLEKVESGEDFAELAQEYSSDGSAPEGGDLGFVDEDTQFVEEFKEAALALEEGETSGLVETQFGYHIIRATEEGDDGRMRVSHILIDRASMQREVQERLEEAAISTYIGVDAQELNQQQTQPEAEEETEES